MAEPTVGTGGSLAIGTNVIGKNVDFDWDGIECALIDVSTLSDKENTNTTQMGSKKYITGRQIDMGTITATLLEPGAITHVGKSYTNVVATLGDGSVFSGAGSIHRARQNNPLEERLELVINVKCSGAWDYTLSTQVPA